MLESERRDDEGRGRGDGETVNHSPIRVVIGTRKVFQTTGLDEIARTQGPRGKGPSSRGIANQGSARGGRTSGDGQAVIKEKGEEAQEHVAPPGAERREWSHGGGKGPPSCWPRKTRSEMRRWLVTSVRRNILKARHTGVISNDYKGLAGVAGGVTACSGSDRCSKYGSSTPSAASECRKSPRLHL